jgi:SAM-dependent methyltransferase
MMRIRHRPAAVAALGASLLVSACAGQPEAITNEQARRTSPSDALLERDAPYVPSPQPIVDAMLRLAGVGPTDRVYDLGSGDGRIVITAARRYGARGVGIDIDPARIAESRENAERAGVSDRVEFRQGDVFEADFSDATVVTLYLLPDVNSRLKPRLLGALQPGTRIVSHAFDMGSWEPLKTRDMGPATLYYWVVPERGPETAGALRAPDPELVAPAGRGGTGP